MTCKELINSIVFDPEQDGYSMEIDDVRKLIAFAYYMGRESASKEVADKYNAHLAQQRQRANECRYTHMAAAIIGHERYLYVSDYEPIMAGLFGQDRTGFTPDDLARFQPLTGQAVKRGEF